MSVKSLLLLLFLAVSVQVEDFRDRIGRGAPDFSFTTKDGERQVKDFRGRWLLLQFGGSWCNPSEATAEVFSRIRRGLEGKPFEFVEIYSDPSLADIELFSTTTFSGIRGIQSSKLPEFYESQYIPLWFLINPGGVVVEVGRFEPAADLEQKVRAKLEVDKAFAGVTWQASPKEEQMEAALTIDRNDREG
jgi:thiol-disulfide isomerase/thioredoxin